MKKIALITMVQASDLPHAFCGLASLAAIDDADLLRLVLLNDEKDEALASRLSEIARAEIISPGENLGVAGGRNRLIQEAKKRGAEFILSVDDDILLPPDFAAIMRDEYAQLQASGARPGILTPATLDFHHVGEVLFNRDKLEQIMLGARVDTPRTAAIREALSQLEHFRARNIYHMGILDWRGAYLYAGDPADHAIQRLYGVPAERKRGAEAHLRHAKGAGQWIIEGAPPREIDSAPGGICFYSVALADELGLHDEAFNPFGFEDADFALRARQKGYRHFCAPRAIAIHDIAARLSERSVAVLRATQGKMAGAFSRKLAPKEERAAAFLAITRRAFDQVVLLEHARREEGVELKTLHRLEGLAAFLGNALLFLMPSWDSRLAPSAERQIDLAARLILSLLPPGVATDMKRDEKGFSIVGADGALMLSVRTIDTDASPSPALHVEAKSVTLKEDYLPLILQTAAGDRDLSFDLSFTLCVGDDMQATIDNFEFRSGELFDIIGSAALDFSQGAPHMVAPIKIAGSRLVVTDRGALARIYRLFAEVDRMPVKEYAAKIAAAAGDSCLRHWLGGEATSIGFEVAGLLDGRPGPLNLTVAFFPQESAPNAAIAKLHREPHPSSRAMPAGARSAPQTKGRKMPSVMNALKSTARKLTAEDPSVAPFPESYNPPKPLRLARRARYIAAGRGISLTPNEARLLSFQNKSKGQRAFIIGNGPSLNKVDLTKLKNEVTFGVNAIYLNQEKMGFLPTHHVVEDVFVAEDRADEINALTGPNKWYGHYLRYCLKPTPGVCWLNVACDYRNYPGFPHFSKNAARVVWVGGTVSYISLQLAYYMGFDEVILVGFDHSYSIPKEAKVEGKAITSTSEDPNHFHPDYFGKGYRWHDPRVDRMEKAYVNARRAYENDGRKVYNATVGGHLEVFERVNYDSLFV